MNDDIKYRLRPHYLFNELAVIRYLVKKDPDAAYDMVYDFSEYMRKNIEAMEVDGPIPLSKELEHMDILLRLEKRSVKKPIQADIRVEGDCMIPARSVILLVEHIIRYSLSPKEGGGCVRVSGKRTPDGFLLELSDDGIGFTEESDAVFSYLEGRFAILPEAKLTKTCIPGSGNRIRIWIGGESNEDHCGR